MTAGDLGGFAERFDSGATAEESYGMLTVDVPAAAWVDALTFARDKLGCTFFDWLTAVDELDEGFSVVVHLWSIAERHHLLLRTRVPRENPRLGSATGVFRGANWHERETYEMFGVVFEGHPNLVPLLLPDGFEGHPLRKEFVLAARAAKPWPGAKEPGESEHEAARAPGRRRTVPPGVPDPQTWGPRPPGTPAAPPVAPPETTGPGASAPPEAAAAPQSHAAVSRERDVATNRSRERDVRTKRRGAEPSEGDAS
jgi:NADH-quinone oxidoreductase subunit C